MTDPEHTPPTTTVDPHHAIRADGITIAVVPCTPACPPSHFTRTNNPDNTTTHLEHNTTTQQGKGG